MEKEHFEILLESIESNAKLLAEAIVGVNQHLVIVDGRLENLEGRMDRVEVGQEVIKADLRDVKERVGRLEDGQEVIKADHEVIKADQEVIKNVVRDIKRNMGLLNSIANDHETRLQGVENKLDDHIDNHS